MRPGYICIVNIHCFFRQQTGATCLILLGSGMGRIAILSSSSCIKLCFHRKRWTCQVPRPKARNGTVHMSAVPKPNRRLALNTCCWCCCCCPSSLLTAVWKPRRKITLRRAPSNVRQKRCITKSVRVCGWHHCCQDPIYGKWLLRSSVLTFSLFMAEQKLTKRERKAAAFKNRKKQKQEFTEDKAFPASDVTDETVDSNKRKREDDDDVDQETKAQQTSSVEEAGENKSKPKQKRSRKGEPQEKKPRYIIFVGNLPYDTTKEALAKHFESVGGEAPTVRLMTEKGTNKPKGFAFVEFQEAAQLKVRMPVLNMGHNNNSLTVVSTESTGVSSYLFQKETDQCRADCGRWRQDRGTQRKVEAKE